MPTQYEQGPEAKAMETGFALDELLRRERGADRRMMGQAVVQRGMADVTQAQALERMVKGEELKEQSAQREAERSAPFIQQLISGNPDVAKTFGFTEQRVTPESLPVPEAGYAGAPATTTTVPRRPSMEEAAGLTRAVPGMAQALLQHTLGQAKGPSVVAPGSSLVSPTGQLLFQAPDRAVQSEEEADRIIAENIARDPNLRGRIVKRQNEKGGWMVSTQPTEQLTEGPNQWLAQSQDMNLPVAQRIQAQLKYNKWFEDQSKLAGAKKEATEAATPLGQEAVKRLETMNTAIQAAYRLQSYTAADREKFTGAGRYALEAARIAREAGSPWLGGYTTEEIDRYSNFVKDNGMIEQFKFAVGGKQLTVGEQKVVEAFIPTGRELTTSEYEAKLKGITAAMEAAQVVDLWLSQTGKGAITPDLIRARYVDELLKRGIDVTKRKAENVQQQMTSGQRLRDKYGQP